MRALPRVLRALALRFPLGVLAATVSLAVLGLVLAATRLEFQTGRGDLVAAGDRDRQLVARYEGEFEELPERVVVVVRSEVPETAGAFATELGRRWEADPDIEKVLYRIDADGLERKALFYLSPDELRALEGRLADHQDLLRDLGRSPTLTTLFALVNRELTTTLVGRLFSADLAPDDAGDEPPDLTALLALLRAMGRWETGSRVFESPWGAFFGTGASTRDGFLRSDDDRLLFILANPRARAGEFNRFQRAVEKIRADVRDVRARYPDLEVGVTGRAVLEADEMAAAKRDMTLAAVISLVGVTLLFVVVFRGVVRPVLAALTLLVGVGWSLGFTTLALGHLNILSIAFMPMLIGLGIDYSIHFIARWEEERSGDQHVGAALARTLRGAGRAIAVAALTTALSFLALALAGFKGLAELGVVSGSGVLLAALASFTTLPALLVLTERGKGARLAPAPGRGRSAESGRPSWILRHPRAALAASVFLVGVSVVGLRGVRLDFNLLHLQAEGTEAAVWAQRIRESEGRSVLFEEVAAGSLGEVRRKVQSLEALPSVADVDSVAAVIPEDQDPKRPLIAAVRPLVADLTLPAVPTGPVDVETLREVLGRIKFKLGDAATEPDDDPTRGERREARAVIDAFLATTRTMSPEDHRTLGAFQAALFRDLRKKLEVLQASAVASPVTVEDLPPALRARYVGRGGQYRLFVFPSDDIWEYGALARFVGDVRSVDPEAHGTPGRTLAYLRAIKEGYEQAALYALPAVALLAVATFRALVPALLALVPLGVGGLWALGSMGLLGVPFNPANLLLLPLIVAIGIDNGIYVVQRFREPPGAAGGAVGLGSTGRAITASALTTMLAFGSLAIAGHRGLQSLGLVVVLGVGSLLVVSLVTLPSLLALLGSARARWHGTVRLATDGGRAPRAEPATTARPGAARPRRVAARAPEFSS